MTTDILLTVLAVTVLLNSISVWLMGKRIDTLKERLPKPTTISMIIDPHDGRQL